MKLLLQLHFFIIFTYFIDFNFNKQLPKPVLVKALKIKISSKCYLMVAYDAFLSKYSSNIKIIKRLFFTLYQLSFGWPLKKLFTISLKNQSQIKPFYFSNCSFCLILVALATQTTSNLYNYLWLYHDLFESSCVISRQFDDYYVHDDN